MSRTPNVIVQAFTVEVVCPHCGSAQPAPGGSEFCEIREAKEMCDGSVKECAACDEQIRMTWPSKAQFGATS